VFLKSFVICLVSFPTFVNITHFFSCFVSAIDVFPTKFLSYVLYCFWFMMESF
jgi:hypothetical protein